ncbi:MAG: DUF998 domain-containing protein [Candidatus Hodarchaeota archaeon]
MKKKNISRLICTIVIFGVLQFFLLTSLAAYYYPGGYSYFKYYFSDLGAVVAKNGEINSISSTFFFISLTLVALALIPFWLIIRLLFTESQVERILSVLGSALGLVSSPFIIGIALFPIDTQLETHILVTLIFFLLFTLATLLYSIAIILNQQYSNYFGFVGVILFIISLIVFINPIAPYVAFLQNIVAYGYFIWIVGPLYLVWPIIGPESSNSA